jgi:hypothetical protein
MQGAAPGEVARQLAEDARPVLGPRGVQLHPAGSRSSLWSVAALVVYPPRSGYPAALMAHPV